LLGFFFAKIAQPERRLICVRHFGENLSLKRGGEKPSMFIQIVSSRDSAAQRHEVR
jgi:hypothetical protein